MCTCHSYFVPVFIKFEGPLVSLKGIHHHQLAKNFIYQNRLVHKNTFSIATSNRNARKTFFVPRIIAKEVKINFKCEFDGNKINHSVIGVNMMALMSNWRHSNFSCNLLIIALLLVFFPKPRQTSNFLLIFVIFKSRPFY